ncbi:hypothetical protein A2755_01555 [Candidatus Wolfebacteria bacterium RIFCSPHIGHO2_01_FULL_48_22]|uniref:Nudix hydrolase domain-containing protein n=2 Tax=Candidatus Wolfeibacteriota TaxID=1752735 RepID=A0A1F8DR03_9BACT|nr:MAG: hypothetical protein A2755_01555 [Candidatus Wolfebacteria bacterium RIFCSPHIGHO2_01_FULL_48_22]OGM91923.1 MAG: hypothetical protein A2935_02195 [Candidatus Wolfebacteria bacterium RIFCSPLOWO2_01_FULL_47_17b]
MQISRWSSFTYIWFYSAEERNFVFVTDSDKPDPKRIKCVGGREKSGVDLFPEDTAIREIKEEIGLEIAFHRVKELIKRNRGKYSDNFFTLEISKNEADKMTKGNDIEEIHIIKEWDIQKYRNNFLTQHFHNLSLVTSSKVLI